MKTILVCGAGGFIGSHLTRSLVEKGNRVIGVDIVNPEWSTTTAEDFYILNLTDTTAVYNLFRTYDFDEVYQLAADMGGAGYIFTGDNDAAIMHNSASINLNIAEACVRHGKPNIKVFYTSSACIYPEYNQLDPDNPTCEESSAYPAEPDSEYGWEKLFSERLYLAYQKNHGIDVRIARLHNIFGPESNFDGGREKAPAALCRKVLQAEDIIEVWGPGTQTRSFLYIDECIEGIHRIMESDVKEPINLGSDRMISINGLVKMICEIAGKDLTIKNIDGPRGVMGRNSDNKMIKELLNWQPQNNLEHGISETYKWISEQINKTKWIYESPDKGKTVYRRPFGAPHHMRELYYENVDGFGRSNRVYKETTEIIQDISGM